jgi:phospholipase/carboxylesterase
MKTFAASIFMLLFYVSACVVKPAGTPSLIYLKRAASEGTDKPALIVLLHGLGSNEKDLFSLADQLPKSHLVVSVRAPFDYGAGAYAWFNVHFTSGAPIIDTIQFEQSLVRLSQFLDELKNTESYNAEDVTFMGFSQGGIMAYSCGLTHPQSIQRIIPIGARLPDEIKARIVPNEALKKMKIHVAHGTQDKRISIDQARLASSYLAQQFGLSISYKEYNAGHEITAAMIQDIQTFLGMSNK